VIDSTLPSLYLVGKSPMYPLNRGLGGFAEPVWKLSRKQEYLTPVGNKVHQKTEKQKNTVNWMSVRKFKLTSVSNTDHVFRVFPVLLPSSKAYYTFSSSCPPWLKLHHGILRRVKVVNLVTILDAKKGRNESFWAKIQCTLYFFCWLYNPLWVCISQPSSVAIASSRTRFLDHTQRRATVGRTLLDEWSVCRRDVYLTTHNTHNRQTSMPPVGFEPTIATGKRP